MPALNEANVRHLLRRTEFVDRPARVTELLGLSTIGAAVDNVMAVPTEAAPPAFDPTLGLYEQGITLAEQWLDRMATLDRPFGERMAFFWHGHLCTDLPKTRGGVFMLEQINLFRQQGLTNVSDLVKAMSVQTAMLRYLDNDQNVKTSPNQNFGRELLELFLLSVGNYTEADVEACTAAWTGHTAHPDTGVYIWAFENHERAPQQFLGKTINAGDLSYRESGNQTIEVVLGTGPLGAGTVPGGAPGSSATVAADFLSLKLWQEFAEANTFAPPAGLASSMRSALINNDFDIRPWVRAMLTHDDFYSPAAMTGLVRQPTEYVVAVLQALGMDARTANVGWLLDRTGQKLLYPPNVSGWKPNGYWVNASAMGARSRIVQECLVWLTTPNWNAPDGYIDLPGGRITKGQMQNDTSTAWVDRLLAGTRLRLSQPAIDRIVAHLDSPDVPWWRRLDGLLLILIDPEMHVA